jgi:hypothetical protein
MLGEEFQQDEMLDVRTIVPSLEPLRGRIGKHLGEEARVYRLAYNGDVVAFKMGRRPGKRVGGSAFWRIGV